MVSVAIDWTLIAQLITFLILMFILNRILYRPILANLRKREGEYRDFEKRATDAQESLKAGKTQEDEARAGALSEGSKLQGTLRSDGQKAEQGILAKAQAEAAEQLEAARAGLRADVEKAKGELKDEAGNLAREIANKILAREIPAQ